MIVVDRDVEDGKGVLKSVTIKESESNIEKIKGFFVGEKKLYPQHIGMINREIENGTFPREMGIIIDEIPLTRNELGILDEIRNDFLGELNPLPGESSGER